MQLSLRRNTQPHPTLLYYLDVDLSRSVVHPRRVSLEVHRRPLRAPRGVMREVYTLEAAGFQLEAGNANNLVRLVQKFLPALVNWARLPDYVFIARRSQRIYPVYTFHDEVIATTPGGPTFRHVELAKVRRWLTEYMHEIGELGAPSAASGPRSEKLHVRGVSRETMKLLRPVFYLKKRIPGQQEFWAPVFEAEDGRSIYVYAASAKRVVPITDGHEVLALRDRVAEALMADQRLLNSHDLRIDRLMPAYWQRLQAILRPQVRALNAGKTATASGFDIPIYRNGEIYLAAEDRRDEHRWGLFVGADLEDLRKRVALDFVRRGLITTPEGVSIIPARAEALKARGLAEAEAMRNKTDSWKEYNQATVTEMFVDVLPELIEESA